MKYRLSLKNDMPLEIKLIFVTAKPVPVSQAENPPFTSSKYVQPRRSYRNNSGNNRVLYEGLKPRGEYGSGVARPEIDANAQFELKGQFLKELHDDTFSGSEHEDANKHIKKVLEIVDIFHIPNITQDQVMLCAFPVSLTGAASRWLKNEPAGSITTWEVLKTKAAGPGFYQRNNVNSSYLARRDTMEESLPKFMAESAKITYGVSLGLGYDVLSPVQLTLLQMKIDLMVSSENVMWCMTRSSTKELLTPFENPERVLRSGRKLFETPSLAESNSPEFDQISEIKEHIEEEEEVILFYNGLDVPTRQILDSRGVILTKTTADAKVAIQEMGKYSHKWHNRTSSKNRSTETSDGLAAIQAQLNSLGQEIKKKGKLKKKPTIHNLVHPINREDNTKQQGQDSTNVTMETLRTQLEETLWKNHYPNLW
ncbi:hypothetical protein Tco_0555751 [Tanacetum coccineum]